MKILTIILFIFISQACSKSFENNEYPYLVGAYKVTIGSKIVKVDEMSNDTLYCMVGDHIYITQNENIVVYNNCIGKLEKDGNKWVSNCFGEQYIIRSGFKHSYEVINGILEFEDNIFTGFVVEEKYTEESYENTTIDFSAKYKEKIVNKKELE